MSSIHSIKVVQATLIMAIITLALAIFAVGVEATIPEEAAKLYTVPALYALILTSAITVATAGIGTLVSKSIR
jgi:hypothetical protein